MYSLCRPIPNITSNIDATLQILRQKQKLQERFYGESLGAGGTTAKPRKPPRILRLTGALQFKLMGVLMDLTL